MKRAVLILVMLLALTACHNAGVPGVSHQPEAGPSGDALAGVDSAPLPPAATSWHGAVKRLTDQEIALAHDRLSAGNPTWWSGIERFEGPLTRERSFDLLLNAEVFATNAIGIGGTPSKEVDAFHVLLRQPDAAAVFNDMLRRGSLVGQLYALYGLLEHDRPAYERAIPRFANDERWIALQSGCMISGTRVRAIAEDSRDGSLVRLPAANAVAEAER